MSKSTEVNKMNPITDDEVLALAEKIKQQRSVDAVYAGAHAQLNELKHDIDNRTKRIHRSVFVDFGTITPDSFIDSVEVTLPMEAADDLIQSLKTILRRNNTEISDFHEFPYSYIN
jgi:hypothetical protein